MSIYKETKDYKLIHDNMLNMGDYIPDGTIDCVITDPPYELGFMGKKWDGSGIAFNVEAWTKCFNALKDGGYLLAFGGTRTFHRIACAIEDAGFEIRDTVMYIYGSGFPKSMDVSKAIDKSMGAEREVVGSYKVGGNAAQSTKEKGGTYASNTNSIGIKPIDINITAPATEQAKQWQGWGTALKPAYEPIIVARKPMKTSVAENVLKNGVGGINIDECRVGDDERFLDPATPAKGTFNCSFSGDYKGKQVIGRFPANIVHDGSNEVVSGFPESEDGDSGNASRFFYTAKASKKDRDEGLGAFDQIKVNDGRQTEIDNAFQRGETLRKNTHPTVKPIELMQYLVRLVAPKGATILDCFMGSNSTGKAVMFENRERNANYKFIGIELTDEYLPICEARIEYAINKYEYDEKIEQAKTGQVSLFDFNFEEKTDV